MQRRYYLLHKFGRVKLSTLFHLITSSRKHTHQTQPNSTQLNSCINKNSSTSLGRVHHQLYTFLMQRKSQKAHHNISLSHSYLSLSLSYSLNFYISFRKNERETLIWMESSVSMFIFFVVSQKRKTLKRQDKFFGIQDKQDRQLIGTV